MMYIRKADREQLKKDLAGIHRRGGGRELIRPSIP